MNMQEKFASHPAEPGRDADHDPLADPVQDPLRDPKWKEDDRERELPGKEGDKQPIREDREVHPEFDEDNTEYPLEDPIETPRPPM